MGGGHGFQGGPGVLILELAARKYRRTFAMDGASTDLMWPPRRLSTLERACRRRSTARIAAEGRYLLLQAIQAARAPERLLPLAARPFSLAHELVPNRAGPAERGIFLPPKPPVRSVWAALDSQPTCKYE